MTPNQAKLRSQWKEESKRQLTVMRDVLRSFQADRARLPNLNAPHAEFVMAGGAKK